MRLALQEAHKAHLLGEVPIGAVIISNSGEVLGMGHNLVEATHSQIEHAEIRAIQAASKKVQDWRLDNCTLYVTLEPCMMCIAAIALSRVERVVYGAASPLFGYNLDKEGVLDLYTKQIKNITDKVLEHESAALLSDFFKKKREMPNE